ncbi:hypothetical protein D9M68_843830 [compost metagenome]
MPAIGVDRSHSGDTGEHGQGHAVHEVRDLRDGQGVAVKGDVLDCGAAFRGFADDGVGHARRKLVLDLLHLGQDFGHCPVGVGIEHQARLDFAAALGRRRTQILDAAGRGDGLRDWRGHEALHHLLGCPRQRRGDVDGGIFEIGVLAHGQGEDRSQACQQDEQTHDQG